MIYRVIVSDRAKSDLDRISLWWAEHYSAEEAIFWYNGFVYAIESLRNFPKRCPLARDEDKFSEEVHELFYGVGSKQTHRARFTILNDTVVVLMIRHMSQAEVEPDKV